MAEIGKMNSLEILKEVDFGVYLDGGELGEILLPNRYLPKYYDLGEFIEVFIYNDSEDRLIATTDKPLAMTGEFAYLKVAAVTQYGAFLDWGLPKDLFVPFKEQKPRMEKGKSYIVRIYLDEKTGRIAASSKQDKFLDKSPADFTEGMEADLLITKKTDLGYKAIINNAHWGVLYENELFQEISIGQKIKGFIKKVREDGKIDLTLNRPGYEKVSGLADEIVNYLKKNDGFVDINDNTSPEIIHKIFGESKKTFKKAVGALYKQRVISIDDDGLRLLS